MLGKWVTNRWARFRCLAYCQYIFMLYSLLSAFVLTALVRSFVSLVFVCCVSLWSSARALPVLFSLSFSHFVSDPLSVFSLHIPRLFCCCCPFFFVFIILLFNFLLLVAFGAAAVNTDGIVDVVHVIVSFRFVSLNAFRVHTSPKMRSTAIVARQWQKRTKWKFGKQKIKQNRTTEKKETTYTQSPSATTVTFNSNTAERV